MKIWCTRITLAALTMLAVLVTLVGCGGGKTAPLEGPSSLEGRSLGRKTYRGLTGSDIDRVLGMETPTTDWQISSNVPGTLGSSTTTTQGTSSLFLQPHGYVPVQSVQLSSLGSRVGTALQMDVQFQGTQSNPGWWGTITVGVDIPSLGVQSSGNGLIVNSYDFTNNLVSGWNTMSFDIPAALQTTLAESYTDLQFTITLNVQSDTTGKYLIDNLRFRGGAAPSTDGGTGGIDSGGQPCTVATPAGLKASPGDGVVRLTWGAIVEATGYRVLRTNNQGATSEFSTTETDFIDTGLENGSAYSYAVIAVGTCGNSSASSSVLATPSRTSKIVRCEALANAITATRGDVTLMVNSDVLVDSYRSADGPYGGSNMGAEGNIVAAGEITNNGGTIRGQQKSHTASDLPIPPVPPGSVNLPLLSTSPGSLNINQASDSITLIPGTYVVQNLNVNFPGAINISPAGPVTIFVTGNLNLGGIENSNGTPANLTFVVMSDGWVNVNGGGSLWGSIYAPTSGINLNSPIFGYVVGASVTLNSGSAVHYDANLPSTCGVPVPKLTCVIPADSNGSWTAVFGYSNPEQENMNVPADAIKNWAGETAGGSKTFRVPEWFIAAGNRVAIVAEAASTATVTWRLLGQVVTANENSSPACEIVKTPLGEGIVVDGVMFHKKYEPAKVDIDATLPAELDPLGKTAQRHLEGAAAVSHDGEAVYDVPLWVPPGRGGIQPDLSVHYGSRQGFGTMGRGFSISGFSRITRCARDVGRDGKAEPINWRTDYFCLDGQRLVPVSGGNGGDGATYRTEVDSYSRITSIGVDERGPKKFTVELKDGRKLSYGSSTGRIEGTATLPVVGPPGGPPSLLPARYAWALDRVEDRFGNYMTIDYTSSTVEGATQFLPSRMSYTGHSSAPPDRTVEFQYRDIQPYNGVRQTYVAGMAFDQTKLLTDLNIKVSGALARNYHFHYIEDHYVPELRIVWESDGISQSAWTIFDWTPEPIYDFSTENLGDISDLPASNLERQILRAADMDGDGRDDLVYQARNPATNRWDWYMRRSKASGRGFEAPERLPMEPLGEQSFSTDIRLADVNADGRTDIAVKQVGSHHYVEPPDPMPPPDCWVGTQYHHTYECINYQCKKDLTQQRWPSHFRWFSNNYPNGLQEGAVEASEAKEADLRYLPCTSLNNLYNNTITLGDFNGDGLADVLRNGTFRRFPGFENRVIDPYSDPKDVYDCHISGEMRWGIRHNSGGLLGQYQLLATVGESNLSIPQPGGNGGPFATTYTSATPGAPGAHDADPLLVDIDGSGRMALLYPKLEYFTKFDHPIPLHAYHPGSRPGSVAQPTDAPFTFSDEIPLSLLYRSPTPSDGTHRYVFADVNGDGLPEAIEYNFNGGPFTMLRNRGGHFSPWEARVPLSSNPTPAQRAAESETTYKTWALPPVSLGQVGWHFLTHAMLPGDFNGDGLTDLVMLDDGCISGKTSRQNLVLFQSNGNTYFAREISAGTSPIPVGDKQKGTGDACGSFLTSLVLDANGDGMPDIAQMENGKLKVYYNSAQPRALESISEGKRKTFDFHYRPYNWTASEVQAPAATPTYPQSGARSGVWVASLLRTRPCPSCAPDQVQGHQFADGRRDLQSRQFIGFARHTVEEYGKGGKTVYTLGNHISWTTPSESDQLVTKRLYPFRDKVLEKSTTITVNASSSNQHVLGSGERVLYYPIGAAVFPGVCPGTRVQRVIDAVDHEDAMSWDLKQFEHEPPYDFAGGFPFTRLVVSDFWYDSFHNVTRRDTTSAWRLVDSQGQPFDQEFPDLDIGPRQQPVSASPLETTSVITVFDYDEKNWLVRKPNSEYRSGTGLDGKSGLQRTKYVTDPVTGAVTDTILDINDPVHSVAEHTTWNEFGLIESVERKGNANIDVNGTWTTQKRLTRYEYSYTPPYAPSAVVNALGQRMETVHSPVTGNIILSVDPDLRTTHYRYDTYGRLRKVQRDGDEDTLSYSYPSATDIIGKTTVTTGRGTYREASFDVYGRSTRSTVTTLNATGQPDTSYTDTTYTNYPPYKVGTSSPYFISSSSFATSTKTFDEAQRLVADTLTYDPSNTDSPAIGPTTYTYSRHDTTVTDGAGRKNTRTLDGLGRLRKTAAVDQGKTVHGYYYYTFSGLPTGFKDDVGNRVSITYDVGGRCQTIEDPDSGKTTFTINAFGEVVRQAQGDNDVRVEVDPLGRVTNRFENGKLATGSTWDAPNATGDIWKTSTSEGIETERTYDGLGRPRSVAWQVGEDRFEVRTQFDFAGRLKQLTYPVATNGSRLVLDYEYGPAAAWASQLTGVRRAGNYVWKLSGADAAGRTTSFSYGNGTQTESTYYLGTNLLKDSTLNLLRGTEKELKRQAHHTYDFAGNILSAEDLTGGTGGSAYYTYDGLNRLWTWKDSFSGTTKQYDYDSAGNLKWIRALGRIGQDVEFSYGDLSKGAGPHAVTRMGAVDDFRYNAMGERIAGDGKGISYTPFGLPSSVVTGGVTTAYSYSADGVRVVRKGSDGTSTISVGGLYERRTVGTSTKDIYYLAVAGQRIAQFSPDPESTTYFHQDYLGSTIGTSDATAGRFAFWRRDPWGRPVASQEPEVRVGFTGHTDDVDTGFIDMGGRVYDPKTTRFLTPDPIQWSAASGMGNRYAYVLNDPTNLVDPTGFNEQPRWADGLALKPSDDWLCYGSWCISRSPEEMEGRDSYIIKDYGTSYVSAGGGGGGGPVCVPLPAVDQTGSISLSSAASGSGSSFGPAGAANPQGGKDGWRSIPFAQREDLGPPGGFWGGEGTGLSGPGITFDSTKGWNDPRDTSLPYEIMRDVGLGMVAGLGGVARGMPTIALRGRQLASEMTRSRIKSMAKAMVKGTFDWKAAGPVRVAERDGMRIILDGHHRVAAARQAGLKEIPIVVEEVTDDVWKTLVREVTEAMWR